MNEADAYRVGWKACREHPGLGITSPIDWPRDLSMAWANGFEDAFGQGSWVEPDPTQRGYFDSDEKEKPG